MPEGHSCCPATAGAGLRQWRMWGAQRKQREEDADRRRPERHTCVFAYASTAGAEKTRLYTAGARAWTAAPAGPRSPRARSPTRPRQRHAPGKRERRDPSCCPAAEGGRPEGLLGTQQQECRLRRSCWVGFAANSHRPPAETSDSEGDHPAPLCVASASPRGRGPCPNARGPRQRRRRGQSPARRSRRSEEAEERRTFASTLQRSPRLRSAGRVGGATDEGGSAASFGMRKL